MFYWEHLFNDNPDVDVDEDEEDDADKYELGVGEFEFGEIKFEGLFGVTFRFIDGDTDELKEDVETFSTLCDDEIEEFESSDNEFDKFSEEVDGDANKLFVPIEVFIISEFIWAFTLLFMLFFVEFDGVDDVVAAAAAANCCAAVDKEK